MDDKKINETV